MGGTFPEVRAREILRLENPKAILLRIAQTLYGAASHAPRNPGHIKGEAAKKLPTSYRLSKFSRQQIG
jgi:hypothetical protein